MCALTICSPCAVRVDVTSWKSRPSSDLDHRMAAEALLSKMTGRHLEDPRPTRQRARPHVLQFAGRLELAGDGGVDPVGQPLQTIFAVERQSRQVLDVENVERHAVGERHDLAPTIDAPDSDIAPAIWAKSPGWSGA